MVLNQGKCNFMCLRRNTENETFVFKNKIITNCEEEEILGVEIDNKLIWKCHVKNLCKKSLEKKMKFSKTIIYLNDAQKRLIFKSIVRA